MNFESIFPKRGAVLGILLNNLPYLPEGAIARRIPKL